MSKKAIRGAVLIGATGLAVVGLAGPAQADNATVYTTKGGGFLEYQDHVSDDVFILKDYLADRYGVRGEIRSGGGTLLSWNYVDDDSKSVSWYRDRHHAHQLRKQGHPRQLAGQEASDQMFQPRSLGG